MCRSKSLSKRTKRGSTRERSPAPVATSTAPLNHRFSSNDLELLTNGHMSDCTLTCGDRRWNLHGLVLTTRCRWFKIALDGGWLETQTRNITITEFTPDLVDAMLHYIYSGGELNLTKVEVQKDESELSSLVKLWVIADFFMLAPMTQDVLDRLRQALEEDHPDVLNQMQPRNVRKEKKQEVSAKLASVVKAAWDDFPHAEPCQDVIFDFARSSKQYYFLEDRSLD